MWFTKLIDVLPCGLGQYDLSVLETECVRHFKTLNLSYCIDLSNVFSLLFLSGLNVKFHLFLIYERVVSLLRK